MSAIDDLLAVLRSALANARQLATAIGASSDRATEMRDRASAVGATGSTAHLGLTVDGLDEGRAHAAAIGTRLESAIRAIEAARTGATSSARRTGTTAEGSSTARPSTGEARRPWSGNPPVVGFRPDRPNQVCIEESRRIGWPANRNGRISARGRLYDRDGRPITGTVEAGDGPATTASDLEEPWASDERMTTRWHIEGHAAAVMRTHQLTEAVLYLNIAPCGVRDRDPWRCNENLPHLLPKGSTLRIWVAREDGNVSRFVYEGTGKALK